MGISASIFGAGRGTDQSVNIHNLTVYQGGSRTGGDLDQEGLLDQENGEERRSRSSFNSWEVGSMNMLLLLFEEAGNRKTRQFWQFWLQLVESVHPVYGHWRLNLQQMHSWMRNRNEYYRR